MTWTSHQRVGAVMACSRSMSAVTFQRRAGLRFFSAISGGAGPARNTDRDLSDDSKRSNLVAGSTTGKAHDAGTSPRVTSDAQPTASGERHTDATSDSGDAASSSAAAETAAQQTRVWTVPNALTMLRIALSPYVAYMIGVGQFEAAVYTLGFAGALDWADGFIARRVKGQASVLGSFLDPLADKVLVGCTGLSLAFAGALHPALVFVVVGRDVLLIAGSLLYRAHTRTASEPFFSLARVSYKVEPTLISKVNTTLQIGLVVTALGSLAWPHAGLALAADTAALLPEWLQAATLPLPPLPVEAVADAAAASSVEAPQATAAGTGLPAPAPAAIDGESRRRLTLTPAVTSLSWLVGGTTIWSGLDYLFREGFGQFKRRLAAGRGSAS